VVAKVKGRSPSTFEEQWITEENSSDYYFIYEKSGYLPASGEKN
jgi:hypothetical protein